MKILYTPSIISGAITALQNHATVNNYGVSIEEFDFLDTTLVLNEMVYDYSKFNSYIIFYQLFFLDSFVKHKGFGCVVDDYEKMDELPFKVNWKVFTETLKSVEEKAREIIEINPEYLFVRFLNSTTLISYYLSYLIKRDSNIIVILGCEKKLPNLYKEKFECVVDNIFIGTGEILLDDIVNGNVKKYKEDYSYTKDNWDTFNFNVSDYEKKHSYFNYILNTKCVYSCNFCSHTSSNKRLHIDNHDILEMANYLNWVNKKYNFKTNNCVSSLAFINNSQIKEFFGTIDKHLPLDLIYLSTEQFYNNTDMLDKFTNTVFYLGVEHFSDKMLKLMNKQTCSRELNLKVLLRSYNTNITFGVIYNYFNETKRDFLDLYSVLNIIKDKYPQMNINQYIHYYGGMVDESVKFIEPIKYKEYFGVEDDTLFFKYVNLHDMDGELITFKSNMVQRLRR